MDDKTIGLYCSHDANLAVKVGPLAYRVVEFERFTRQRNFSLVEQSDPENVLRQGLRFLGVDTPSTAIVNWASQGIKTTLRSLGVKEVIDDKHHWAHAAVAYYTSPFQSSAWIVSYDGGGDDLSEGMASFKVFRMEKQKLTVEATVPIDLGTPFMVSAYPLEPIKKGPNLLSWSGKLMGLSGFGTFDQDYVDKLRIFYSQQGIYSRYPTSLVEIDPTFVVDGLTGTAAFNFAFASQFVFAEKALSTIQPILNKQPDWPVCMTGGCSLNVLVNQSLRDAGYTVHVPPNPNDAGLSVGLLLLNNPPNEWPVKIQGLPSIEKILASNTHDQTIDFYGARELSVEELVKKIYDGKILGLFVGDSEAGPRALGYRSLICRADDIGVKNTLNAKIKGREWFRPFAPVVLNEDKTNYFQMDLTHDSPSMSFSPKVKCPKDLEAITHIDGTARVQTVHDRSTILGQILSKVKADGLIRPVLLNTSLNARGRPIVASIGDAVTNIFGQTPLDGLVFEKTNGSLWALLR